MTRHAAITGWGHAIPDTVVDNAFFESRVDTSDEWIVERTGIRQRRIATPTETTASLASTAARRVTERTTSMCLVNCWGCLRRRSRSLKRKA